MRRPEVADAGACQRQQRQQAAANQQRHKGPAGQPRLVPGRRPQPERVQQRRQHGHLAYKTRQRRQARHQQRGDHEGQPQKGGGCGNGFAHQHGLVVVQVQAGRGHQFGVQERRLVGTRLVRQAAGFLVAPAVDQVAEQKQRAHRQRRAGQVVQQAGREPVLAKADGRQQRARRQHRSVAGQVAQALRAQHAERAKGHGQEARAGQPQAAKQRRVAGLAAKHQRPQPQDGVHAHLGHDGKQRAHRRGGSAVGRHQPEVERPHGGLDEKGGGQDGGGRVQQAAVAGLHLRHALRQVGHVERAGQAVEHRHANQEQRRRRQVDGNEVQPGLHPRLARAVQQQAVGGGQHDLEKHEQVEQVAGQKGPGQPHQLKLEQRVVMHPGPVPAGRSVQRRRQPEHAGQHQHQRRQAVQRQHDAKRRRPVAGQVHAHGGRLAQLAGPDHQSHGHHQAQKRGGNAQHQLGALLLLAHQQHDGSGQQRQHDGRQQQVRHGLLDQGVQGVVHEGLCRSCASLPSTWSVPDRPREASSTTRNSAVMAKPMTMAVSTSACGSGSA